MILRGQVKIKVQNFLRILRLKNTNLNRFMARACIGDIDQGVVAVLSGVKRIDERFPRALLINVEGRLRTVDGHNRGHRNCEWQNLLLAHESLPTGK